MICCKADSRSHTLVTFTLNYIYTQLATHAQDGIVVQTIQGGYLGVAEAAPSHTVAMPLTSHITQLFSILLQQWM